MSDADLVRRAQRGDPESREALARTWLPTAYAVALAATGRAPEAEDAVQEGFLRAFREIDGLRDPARFGPWLLRIVRNAARDGRRRTARTAPLGEAGERLPARERQDGQAADRGTLAAWRALPERERLVCWLKVVDGMPLRDIAALLGTSKSAAHRALARALARLRKEVSRC